MKSPHPLFSDRRPRKFHRLLVRFVPALCLAGMGGALMSFPITALGQDPSPGGSRQGVTQQVEMAQPVGAAGRKIYVDPVTGKFGAPPTETNNLTRPLPTEAQKTSSSSATGLVETQVTSPAGGVKMDLQGRFRSEVVAGVDAQTNLSIRCVPGTPASPDLKPEKDATAPVSVSKDKATQRGN